MKKMKITQRIKREDVDRLLVTISRILLVTTATEQIYERIFMKKLLFFIAFIFIIFV